MVDSWVGRAGSSPHPGNLPDAFARRAGGKRRLISTAPARCASTQTAPNHGLPARATRAYGRDLCAPIPTASLHHGPKVTHHLLQALADLA